MIPQQSFKVMALIILCLSGLAGCIAPMPGQLAGAAVDKPMALGADDGPILPEPVWDVYKKPGQPSQPPTSPATTFTNPVSGLARWYTQANGWTSDHPRLLGDVNGDGKADIVGFASDGVYLSLGSGNNFPDGTLVLASYGQTVGSWTQDNPRALGDVNGDGKADIVGFGNDGVYLSLSTGVGFGEPLLTVRSYGSNVGGWTKDNPRALGDVNGDGKADIVGFGNDGVYLSLSTGAGFGEPVLTVRSYGSNVGGWTSENPRALGDVNGDRMVDIVGFGNTGVYLSLSTGTGFGEPVLTVPNYGLNAGNWTSDHPRRVADVNGDGKADIVGFANDGVYLSLSTGAGFQYPAFTLASFAVNAGGWTKDNLRAVGDINGDGKADIVGFSNSDVMLSTAITN